ncbi:MAG: (d)CMP kinase [Tessaracoccus sp.]
MTQSVLDSDRRADGSGKSTTSKLLATRLGLGYLDTGSMYRGHGALSRGVSRGWGAA